MVREECRIYKDETNSVMAADLIERNKCPELQEFASENGYNDGK